MIKNKRTRTKWIIFFASFLFVLMPFILAEAKEAVANTVVVPEAPLFIYTNDGLQSFQDENLEVTGKVLAKETVIQVQGLVMQENKVIGFQLKIDEKKQYVPADTTQIRADYVNYFTKKKRYIVAQKDLKIFDENTLKKQKSTLKKGKYKKIQKIIVVNKTPVIQISKNQFISASKKEGLLTDASLPDYYTESKTYALATKKVQMYANVGGTVKKGVLNSGDYQKISRVVYDEKGVPQLRLTNGRYISAKKSTVKCTSVSLNNFYTKKRKAAFKTKKKSFYYSGLLTKKQGNYLPKDSVVNVSKISFTENGTPVIVTPYGNLSANKQQGKFTSEKERVVMKVPYYNQMAYGYPQGCEEFSLYMALKYLGATKGESVQMVTDSVPRTVVGGNPNKGFNGSPKEKSDGRYRTIWPKAFLPYAKRYAKHSENISGSTLNNIKKELKKGRPVVIWGTYPTGSQAIISANNFYGYKVVANHHIQLISGVDEKNGRFWVNDPVSGQFWVEQNRMYQSYTPNKFAVSIGK